MSPRLLIVEDDEATLSVMHDIFRADGFEVDGVHRLQEARALHAERRYACVITGLSLGARSNEDGFEVAAAARSRDPAAPVILLADDGTPSVVQRARQSGVYAVLLKPLPVSEIARVVRESTRIEIAG